MAVPVLHACSAGSERKIPQKHIGAGSVRRSCRGRVIDQTMKQTCREAGTAEEISISRERLGRCAIPPRPYTPLWYSPRL